MSIAAAIRRGLDRFIGGRGEYSITVPVMDGPLKPNDRLERATGILTLDDADNLAVLGQRLLASSGRRVVELEPDGICRTHSEYEAPVTCLSVSEQGALAIGLDGTGVKIVGGRHDGVLIDRLGTSALNCPTGAVFVGEDTLIVSNGSAHFSASQWQHDLIHHGHSGTVARVDLATGVARDLATALRFPAGLCVPADDVGDVLVSETWRHRVLRLAMDSSAPPPREVLAGLPAYPGRMCRSASGGYWLACFASRSQLQEFVLREDRFRRQMIAEIEPEFWIAPSLSSGKSFKEPLQAGGVIRLGVRKPWAPTRSYGLVIRLDQEFQPAWSAHSRADGSRHGITSLVETEGRLIFTSKGKGELVAMEHTALADPETLFIGEAA